MNFECPYCTDEFERKDALYQFLSHIEGGKDVTMYVTAGDKVITSKYSGTEVKLDGEEYTIVRQSDILAVVE